MRQESRRVTARRDALAYFLSFRTYGTWLHGDARGSVDDRQRARGAPRIPENPQWSGHERYLMAQEPMLFSIEQRRVCERAIIETCAHRGWRMRAVNVRTNHVHVVVTAQHSPERVMRDLKSYATRALREHGLVIENRLVWARHGSTQLIFTPEGVERACIYTVEQQGPRMGKVGTDC